MTLSLCLTPGLISPWMTLVFPATFQIFVPARTPASLGHALSHSASTYVLLRTRVVYTDNRVVANTSTELHLHPRRPYHGHRWDRRVHRSHGSTPSNQLVSLRKCAKSSRRNCRLRVHTHHHHCYYLFGKGQPPSASPRRRRQVR
jgi:hypothetical protein